MSIEAFFAGYFVCAFLCMAFYWATEDKGDRDVGVMILAGVVWPLVATILTAMVLGDRFRRDAKK